MEDCLKVDLSEYEAFVRRMSTASGAFKKEFDNFLEALGVEFLRVVQETIITTNTMDTRRLLNSFSKGSQDGVWEAGDGFLTVGTNVEYAELANDGHNQNARFVPGYWQGDKFIYSPDANTGMMLTTRWVEGKHYWDIALKAMDKIIPKFAEKKLEEWLTNYFSEFL